MTAVLDPRTEPRISRRATHASSLPLLPRRLAVAILLFASFVPFAKDNAGWAVVILACVLACVARRDAFARLRLSLPVLPFLGWAALSVWWSVDPSASAWSITVLLVMTVVAWSIAQGRTSAEFLEVACHAMLLALVLSWLTAALLPEVGYTQDGVDAGSFKGLLDQKNLMGYFATLALVTTLCQMAQSPAARRPAYLVGAALAAASLAATTSGTAVAITALVAGVTAVLVLVARLRAPRGLGIATGTLLVGAVVALLLANPTAVTGALDKDPTLTGRTKIWSVVEGAIAQRPVNGYGWGALWHEGVPVTDYLWAANGYPFYHSHNGYLDVTAQLGYVGAVLLVGALACFLLLHARRFLHRPSSAELWPLLVVLVALTYNATEVVAVRDIGWVLLVANSTIVSSKVSR